MRFVLLIVFSCLLPLFVRAATPDAALAPARYDAFVGDWLPKEPGGYVAQVFATGSHAYQANVLAAFDDESSATPVAVLRGSRADGQSPVALSGGDGGGWTGVIRPDCCGSPQMEIANSKTGEKARFSQFMRPNPRLRAKPPEGASVLFAERMRDGVFVLAKEHDPLLSQEKQTGGRLHLEFRMTNNESAAVVSAWAGAHIGLFAHYGRNEKTGCGALLAPALVSPAVRAERALLEWQALDVEMAGGRITVFLNGVKIHDNLACAEPPEKHAPVTIETRGAPVEFRNLWMLAR